MEGRWFKSAGKAVAACSGKVERMPSAYSIRIRGVVQGVGFRPFVFRLARANTLAGWVLNGEDGVEIFVEGAAAGLQAFVQMLRIEPPPASCITEIEIQPSEPVGLSDFIIRQSRQCERPSAGMSPDWRSVEIV